MLAARLPGDQWLSGPSMAPHGKSFLVTLRRKIHRHAWALLWLLRSAIQDLKLTSTFKFRLNAGTQIKASYTKGEREKPNVRVHSCETLLFESLSA